MTKYFSDCVDALLLDIEGTTTPVDYVFRVLFPFARVHVESFLQTHDWDSAVQADLKRLWQEYEADVAQGFSVPKWKDNQTSGAVPYIDYLISIDRKSTGLKSLQGKIWEQGYRDGTLRSRTFTDVKPAFEPDFPVLLGSFDHLQLEVSRCDTFLDFLLQNSIFL